MAFNRFDERRSTYNFEKRGSSRTFMRAESPLSSPLFRKKQFMNGNASVPSSLASSRDSSLDRSHETAAAPATAFHQVVSRVMSSPKMSLRKRFAVIRSGSFSDAKTTLDSKRKKWMLERSGSLRIPGKYKKEAMEESPWSSPEVDRRGSLPVHSPLLRGRSIDRVQLMENRGYCSSSNNNNNDEDSGKIKGFVNR